MKHLITKVEYITGNTRDSHCVSIETDNIEETRKELHGLVRCERIVLVYESEKK